MKALTDNNIVARCLAFTARIAIRHRFGVIFASALLFVASILITIKFPGIEFDTDRDNLVAQKLYAACGFQLSTMVPMRLMLGT